MLRKARHLRKQAVRVKFTVLVSSALLTHTAAWKRTNLIVQWSRSGRIVSTQECTHVEVKGEFQTYVRWDEPLSLVATLYRADSSHGQQHAPDFQEKAYQFKLWEVKNKRLSKLLAEGALDFAPLANVPGNTKRSLELSPTSTKIKQAMLSMSTSAQFLENDDGMSDTRSEVSGVTFHSTDAEALEGRRSIRSSVGGGGGAGPSSGDNYQNPFDEKNPFEDGRPSEEFSVEPVASEALNKLNQIEESSQQKADVKAIHRELRDLRELLRHEKEENDRNLQHLVKALAEAKVRLAESEYAKAESELNYRKQIASLKLKVLQEQENITRLEAKYAGASVK